MPKVVDYLYSAHFSAYFLPSRDAKELEEDKATTDDWLGRWKKQNEPRA